MVGWQTFPRAFLNLLIFGLAMLGGDWLVHQAAYLIEYGSRFDGVMANSPHRYYMGIAGVFLAASALGLLTLAIVVLRVLARRRRDLLRALSPRLARHMGATATHIPVWMIGKTALVLAVGQVAIFLLQENLEAGAEGLGLPGFGVLFGPEHLSVLPLHLLVALCSAVLLWFIADSIDRARRATHLVEALVNLLSKSHVVPVRLTATSHHTPNLRHVAGILGLRSPPLIA